MPQELLLHIGAHKTGTTTIQNALAFYRDVLRDRGVSYVTMGTQPNLHAALGPEVAGAYGPDGFTVRQPEALLAAFKTADQPRVIASSENFSFFFRRENVEWLARLLAPRFNKVRVVCWLRRQDHHIVSHHQEGAKPNRRAEESMFGLEPGAIPWTAPYADRYLDYNSRIGHWLDVFGIENTLVRPFDRARLIGGDAWLDFLDAAEIDPSGISRAETKNVASGIAASKLGHLMAQRDISMLTRRQILRLLPPTEEKMAPSREDALRFYDRYRSGNEALARRLGMSPGESLFDEDFSQWPENGSETWTENSAEAAIFALLDLIKRREATTGADALRRAAEVARRAGDHALALELVAGALELRPEGPAILALHEEIRNEAAKPRKKRRLFR